MSQFTTPSVDRFLVGYERNEQEVDSKEGFTKVDLEKDQVFIWQLSGKNSPLSIKAGAS